jgi:hypothetical protein
MLQARPDRRAVRPPPLAPQVGSKAAEKRTPPRYAHDSYEQVGRP